MRYKITQDQFEELKIRLDRVLARHNWDIHDLANYYCPENFPEVDDFRMRRLWDVFWTTNPKWRRNWCQVIYADGCNDEHIYSALKRWERLRLKAD